MGCGGTKAAQVAPAGGADDTVGELLQRNGLGEYRDKMDELGWDDLDHLSTLDSKRLQQVAQSAGMTKPGHVSRFTKAILGRHSTFRASEPEAAGRESRGVSAGRPSSSTESKAAYEASQEAT